MEGDLWDDVQHERSGVMLCFHQPVHMHMCHWLHVGKSAVLRAASGPWRDEYKR
jgi:hypothetical protein